jgi:hypothetical protein
MGRLKVYQRINTSKVRIKFADYLSFFHYSGAIENNCSFLDEPNKVMTNARSKQQEKFNFKNLSTNPEEPLCAEEGVYGQCLHLLSRVLTTSDLTQRCLRAEG